MSWWRRAGGGASGGLFTLGYSFPSFNLWFGGRALSAGLEFLSGVDSVLPAKDIRAV